MASRPEEEAAGDLLVAGLDGCRAGWVLATVPLRATGPPQIEVVSHLHEVIARLRAGTLRGSGNRYPYRIGARRPPPGRR